MGLSTWALDVADDGTSLVVHELNANLSDTTTRACCSRKTPTMSVLIGSKSAINSTEIVGFIAYRYGRELGSP